MIQRVLRHLLLLVLALGTVQASWSQGITTAAMNGTITDNKDQALPGATVIAVHQPTGTQYVAATNADGRFNIQNMRVGGPYNVKVTFVGFSDVARTGLFLTLAQNQRIDVKLSESTTQISEVAVTGRRDPVINSGRTGAATNVQREQIERLPSLSRSFQDFTRLTPQSNGLNFAGRNGNYNNLTIDGAIFNNSFGLSSTPGGQANAQPISIDAIQELQVSLAPYDVRQGSFTGAGINAITRSGTNDISASIYAFHRSNSLVGSRVTNIQQPFPDFSLNQIGARIGGPIIKNKLFYFLSVEGERRNDPPGTFVANRPGLPAPGPGSNTSAASAAELGALSSFLQTQYNYNTGPYEGYQLKTYSDKITAKIDWNINDKNTFSIKYNYLKSYRDVPPSNSGSPTVTGGRSLSTNTLPFLASYYRINNNLNSFIAELNSTLSNRLSNQLQAGFTAQRDFRSSLGGSPFPFVDILYNANGPGASGNEFTSFGYELFTPINVLNSDIYQLSDNVSLTAGNHVVTVGTYNELYKFANGFAPDLYGRYRFNSLTDFYNSAGFDYNPSTLAITPRAGGALASATNNYTVRYALNVDGQNSSGNFPLALTKAMQLGFYAQDEWNVQPNLKVTTGLRIDIPVILSDLARNNDAATTQFRDGYQILTDQVQKTSLLFSPRIGFNWDVNNDGKTQLRGGTGVFTGRVPYVWISNQASNNGLLGGVISTSGVAFNPTPGFIPVTNPVTSPTTLPATYNLAATDHNFKFPQVWRTNIGFDQRLPGDIIFTFDAIFTKDINAVYFDNVNLPNPQTRIGYPDGQGDTRALYRLPNALNTRAFQVSPKIVSSDGAIVMRNTTKGYSYTVTPQLQKTFSNGVAATLAYTYTDSRDVGIGGSTPFTLWSGRPVSGDPNANITGYSDFLRSHRVVASLSYRKEYLGHLATTLSAFLDAGPNGRYSYVYNGDLNGDGVGNNDLMYVPRNKNEILLINQTLFSGTPQQTIYTADQQWVDLDNYINQDKYLSKHRGDYAERNGAVAPWVAFVDARLLQDVFTNIGKNRNTLQFSLDVFNIGNLLNSNWGVSQSPQRASLLTLDSSNNNANNFDQAAGRPRLSFNPIVNTRSVFADGSTTTSVQTLNTTNRYNTTETSRYRIQLGLRYSFN